MLMSTPLSGIGAWPKGAEQALAAIDKGRKMGAKTQRERDYLEAVAAYYEDFAGRTERARQLARAKAYETLAAKYPDDDEAQIFYALYLACTQLQSDQTYAAWLKAAGNRRSADAAKRSNAPDDALHALDYMTYAYLQLGRDGDAGKVFDEIRTLAAINPARATGPYALAAMPARYAVERGAWGEAAN